MNLFETNLLPISGEFKSHRYSLSQCLRKIHSVLGESYVSVNSNWVHPPLANPWENFFEQANPGHPGKFFCLIPCPGAKYGGKIPRGWGTMLPNSRKLPLKLAKNPQEIQKNYETVQIFCLENLRKLLYFRLKQNHSEVFKYSSLQ